MSGKASIVTIAGRPVARVGLGCMGMSFSYGTDAGSDDSARVVASAASQGRRNAAIMLDTADVYGPFTNELLLSGAFDGVDPDAVLVATKGGLVATGDGNRTRVDGRPERLRRAVEGSLRRLGADRLDLYYLHRVDPGVPLEESWGALGDLVAEGKITALGLSEIDVVDLNVAHGIHPVAAVQSELSLFRRIQLDAVVPWCEAHGAAFVAYAPLGRGFLTGAVDEGTSLPGDDFRTRLPLFAPEAVQRNQALLDDVKAVARAHDSTPGQVALAWLRAQSSSIVAVAGTRRVGRMQENLASMSLHLDAVEVDLLTTVPEPPSRVTHHPSSTVLIV